MELSNKYKTFKVDGSSLIESVVAITIIAICLFIGLLLNITILDRSSLVANHKVKQELNKLIIDYRIDRDYETEVFTYQTFVIKKSVHNFENNTALKEVRFLVHDDRDTLLHRYLFIDTD